MKRYLFGLGAMLVGAGLMFIFTHTEVSAESEVRKPDLFTCSMHDVNFSLWHCETKKLDCGMGLDGISCVKKGLFN
jgi:NAD(P)H-hydrate repair Nnr-like enzyme with NAD(P)H-hydrate dehydratase domain